MIILLSIGAFILGLFTDLFWTKWMQSVAEKRPVVAANWSVLVYAVGILYTLLILDKLVVPVFFYLVGGWIGTYLAVKFKRGK